MDFDNFLYKEYGFSYTRKDKRVAFSRWLKKYHPELIHTKIIKKAPVA